ncbi:sensor histidine kinase [Microbacterium sp. 18062]|uniref:sensor histidine kinase n=1 Tax=Microbacterium sp. 18062 TaxID=2681410 RepID=UPI00135A871F|nr:histidine kinase [Microbacterium sp. 18062]
MTTPRLAPADDDAPRVGQRALARGVTATWWYTFSGVVFLGIVSMSQWLLWLPVRFDDVAWRLVLTSGAAALALCGLVVLLHAYRLDALGARDEGGLRLPPRDLIGLGTTAAAAVLLGVAMGSWLAGVGIVALALGVRPWPPHVRWRVILALTAVLGALWAAETHWWTTPTTSSPVFFVPAFFATLLPFAVTSSLWWWDIVLELDRARRAESLLAATRERLRLANDVHDLQGHHLQVIALQLELSQRLMDRDPEAAASEIARARAAVDDARQGTRDLATAFRGVPLPDELENAADLLRSAGLDVQARMEADAADAPADVLGPIVRESVTNVLKHGDGRWARLSLERSGDHWVYRIVNDDAEAGGVAWGSGVGVMTERARAAGGEAYVRREAETFELTVSLPAATVRRPRAQLQGSA